ncbi:DNA pilot protein [Microviridae sp.]|nr:DNA pilot protein [Microviridae sp.]
MGWLGALAGGLNLIEGRRQNLWDKQASTRERNWQAELANSAYQRAMRDMRAAGLNPILAYKTGGAATPSTTQGQNVRAGTLGTAVTTAIQASRARAEIENLETSAELNAQRAKTEKANTDIKENEATLQQRYGSQSGGFGRTAGTFDRMINTIRKALGIDIQRRSDIERQSLPPARSRTGRDVRRDRKRDRKFIINDLNQIRRNYKAYQKRMRKQRREKARKLRKSKEFERQFRPPSSQYRR